MIITFKSTHAAMKAERALNKSGVPIVMIPVPRYITSDCGIALRFPAGRREETEGILEEHSVEYAGVYEEQ